MSLEKLSGLTSLERTARERLYGIGLVTGLTLGVVAVHGYHPYAEDGGLYMAGVKKLLDPAMYPHGSEFVTAHLRFSVFAPLVAGLVGMLPLSVEGIMLLLHLVSVWLTLFAAWMIAERCSESREGRSGAVGLLAAWITLPIAGTSLMLMDPYVTARSFSTPLVLLALVSILEWKGGGRWGLWLGCGALVAAAVVHPLMAAYGAGCVLMLSCMLSETRAARVGTGLGLCGLAIAVAAVLQVCAPAESAAYVRVAMTRAYWFVWGWQWYEWMGLIAPIAILGWTIRRPSTPAQRGLAQMGVAVGGTAMIVAGMFARAGCATHLVARLQPLRVFQMVYVVMILGLGAWAGERLLRRSVVRWSSTAVVLGAVMVAGERATFPYSGHLELPPGMQTTLPQDQWVQAFLWIRQHAPKDALFALDAHYITEPGEDAQGFRAIAERSVLPDYSKDGGEAAITPTLAEAWVAGQGAQTRLEEASDEQRVRALGPLQVGWVVLRRVSTTQFDCPYKNATVQVCRLPLQAQP